MSVTLREITSADYEQWKPLWLGYLDFYETKLPEEITEITWERLNDSEFNLYGIVAESDGKLMGLAHYSYRPSSWAINDYCYLEDLFVDPDFRGAGAGRSLIDAVIAAARAKESGRVYWNTKASNTRARVLYDSYTLASDFVQYRLPQTY